MALATAVVFVVAAARITATLLGVTTALGLWVALWLGTGAAIVLLASVRLWVATAGAAGVATAVLLASVGLWVALLLVVTPIVTGVIAAILVAVVTTIAIMIATIIVTVVTIRVVIAAIAVMVVAAVVVATVSVMVAVVPVMVAACLAIPLVMHWVLWVGVVMWVAAVADEGLVMAATVAIIAGTISTGIAPWTWAVDDYLIAVIQIKAGVLRWQARGRYPAATIIVPV